MSNVLWGIHAGSNGEADAFFRSGFIAVSWQPTPDLTTLPKNREAYKEMVRSSHPHMKDGAVPGVAGQLFRFLNEINVGDYVVYRSKISGLIHIGEISGPYEYRPDLNDEFPHVRKTRWITETPPLSVTQGARFEIGSAMTLFQIRNYAEEWLAILSGTSVAPTDESTDDDPTIAIVAEDIEDLTKDFILSNLSRELKGHPFAVFVAHLLGTMGYRTRTSPPGADGGIDVIAHKDELGFEPPIVKVQVKSGTGKVGQPDVSALIGTLSSGEFGLVVTLSDFTPQAHAFAKNKANIRLINAEDVVDLILEHYDQLDSKYKAIIPLKSVFVPQPGSD